MESIVFRFVRGVESKRLLGKNADDNEAGSCYSRRRVEEVLLIPFVSYDAL